MLLLGGPQRGDALHLAAAGVPKVVADHRDHRDAVLVGRGDPR